MSIVGDSKMALDRHWLDGVAARPHQRANVYKYEGTYAEWLHDCLRTFSGMIAGLSNARNQAQAERVPCANVDVGT